VCTRGSNRVLLGGPSTSPLGAMETNTRVSLSNWPVYSPRQIGVAAVLGSPLAAAWFFSRNYAALGDEPLSRRSIWLGIAATIGVGAIAYQLPAKVPNLLLPLLYCAAIEQYASWCFKAKYEKHLSEGGPKGSWWMVVWFSLVICMILVALVFGAAFLLLRSGHGT
jgi:hypothetical protein